MAARVRGARLIPTDERIREILTHPEVYPHIGDDYSPPVAQFNPSPACYLEFDGVLVMLAPMMQTVWTAHIAALPESRGKGAEAVRLAADWLRENTRAESVLAMFPDGSMAAGLVGRAGFVSVGTVPDSFRRGGRLLPLHIYSLRIR